MQDIVRSLMGHDVWPIEQCRFR